jgi:CMP-N-acetylneuraminic acid synthetase
MNHRDVIAIITARGGSKGLPRKNVRLLDGKPLIAYSILAARECPAISRCIVSTDDAEIKRVSLAWGAEVIDRPLPLSTDGALSQDAVRHVLETLRNRRESADCFTLLQPTSPLRTAGHLSECLELFHASDWKSAISVTDVDHHPYKCLQIADSGLQPLFDRESLDKPRQSLPHIYRQNGAIYVAGCEDFLAENSFFIPRVMPYVMGQETSIDIDTEFDLFLSEQVIRRDRTEPDHISAGGRP